MIHSHPIGMNIMRTLLLLLSMSVVPLPTVAQKLVEKVVKERVDSENGAYRIVQVVEGVSHPWAVGWLPDGSMILTQRNGQMYVQRGKEIKQVAGVPKVHTTDGGQGGLLDVAVHPDHASNGWIYFTYSSPGDNDGYTGGAKNGTGTALARARLQDENGEPRLVDLETLYTQVPRTEPGRHYGSRIVFPGDGTVIFSIGDRGLRSPAQDLTDPAGSMIRIKEGGGVPDDNPFVGKPPGNIRPEIWSFGHRNNQGLALHPETGELWTTEHGPRGGDLLHRVLPGRNYGWPMVSFGTEYSTGEKIGIGQEAPGVEKPIQVWKEALAPSGTSFYTGNKFPAWQGNLFAGFLAGKHVKRIVLENGTVTHEEVLCRDAIGRIRDVQEGPDGSIYLVTDESNGGIYRLEPVK